MNCSYCINRLIVRKTRQDHHVSSHKCITVPVYFDWSKLNVNESFRINRINFAIFIEKRLQNLFFARTCFTCYTGARPISTTGSFLLGAGRAVIAPRGCGGSDGSRGTGLQVSGCALGVAVSLLKHPAAPLAFFNC